MKKLFIIRHAKSSWKDMTLNDFDRPLNKRGKANIPVMAKRLKVKKVLPDIILSSPALRAKTTAKKIAKILGYEKEIVFDKNIYEKGVRGLDKILKVIENKNDVAFIFGHNPEFEELAELYVDFEENLPTCGMIEIEFDCKKWSDIGPKNARFISFDYPKKLYTLPLEKMKKDMS